MFCRLQPGRELFQAFKSGAHRRIISLPSIPHDIRNTNGRLPHENSTRPASAELVGGIVGGVGVGVGVGADGITGLGLAFGLIGRASGFTVDGRPTVTCACFGGGRAVFAPEALSCFVVVFWLASSGAALI